RRPEASIFDRRPASVSSSAFLVRHARAHRRQPKNEVSARPGIGAPLPEGRRDQVGAYGTRPGHDVEEGSARGSPPSPSPARGRGWVPSSGCLGSGPLLVVVDLLEVGVDHLLRAAARLLPAAGLAGAGRAARTRGARTAAGIAARALARLVHRLAELHRDL